MPLALLVVGGGALVVGAMAGGAALGALRGGRWTSAARRGLVGLLLVALGGLAGAIAIGLPGYPALTVQDLAAAGTTEPEGPPRVPPPIPFPHPPPPPHPLP